MSGAQDSAVAARACVFCAVAALRDALATLG